LHRSENKVESLTGESRRAVQMKLNTTLILPLSNERDARDVSKRSNRWGWRGSLVFSFTVYGVYCHDMFLRIALFRVWAWWHLLLWCVCVCHCTHTHTLYVDAPHLHYWQFRTPSHWFYFLQEMLSKPYHHESVARPYHRRLN